MGFKEVNGGGKFTHIGGTKEESGEAWPKEIEGYYVKVTSQQSKFNPEKQSYTYWLDTENGQVGVYGRGYLDNLMRKLGDPQGQMIRIEANGMDKKPGKKAAFNYKVFEDAGNKKDLNEETAYDDTDSEEDDVPLDAIDARRPVHTGATPKLDPAAVQAKLKASQQARK